MFMSAMTQEQDDVGFKIHRSNLFFLSPFGCSCLVLDLFSFDTIEMFYIGMYFVFLLTGVSYVFLSNKKSFFFCFQLKNSQVSRCALY